MRRYAESLFRSRLYKWFHISLEPKCHARRANCAFYYLLHIIIIGRRYTSYTYFIFVTVRVHLCRVCVCLCASVWRNMVKCICICTRLSLSAMRANSLRQIKHSPVFAGRVKLARRIPLKKEKLMYGIRSSGIFVLFPFLSLCLAYPLLRKSTRTNKMENWCHMLYLWMILCAQWERQTATMAMTMTRLTTKRMRKKEFSYIFLVEHIFRAFHRPPLPSPHGWLAFGSERKRAFNAALFIIPRYIPKYCLFPNLIKSTIKSEYMRNK